MGKKTKNASSGKKGSADRGASSDGAAGGASGTDGAQASSKGGAVDGAPGKSSADDGALNADSALGGASLLDRALGGASLDRALGGASESAAAAGASYAAKRAAMASALDFGADEGIMKSCSKLIMKNAEKMSRPEQYPSWAASMLTLLSVTCVQGWAIATGNTTPTSVLDPKTGQVTKVEGKEAQIRHQREVFDPNNRWLYALLITYMKGAKMRTIVMQATPNDGEGLWRMLKARMERGGAVRKRALLQQFWRAAMHPGQTIVEWTDELGKMRVNLADQFCVDISDTDICGQALQGIKAMYRSARNALNTEADKPGVLWEDFVVKLHQACDVIDLDSQADVEREEKVAYAHMVIKRKKSQDARIRELEAEIAKLRRENAAAEESDDGSEEWDDAAEESDGAAEERDTELADAGLAFAF